MPNPGNDNEPSAQTRLACNSCKMRKRKCDKAFPQCSQCAKRRSSLCEYPKAGPRTPATENDGVWHTHLVSEDQVAIESIDYPTVLFLDPTILQHGQVELPRATDPIPAHVLALLGGIDEVQHTASTYFETIHVWMPFISKKRFYGIHLRNSFQAQSDVDLLLLALKLITTTPLPRPRNPRTPLYYVVKHFYTNFESSSSFSFVVLQAKILIALYELLHAIYPAAFLSIGACARYAHALGINDNTSVNAKRVLTLVEVEERSRVWWAIVILDRFVSIGHPGRPFATADPGLDDLLPADDTAWDQGSHEQIRALCQAARLLGQVLQHVSTTSPDDDIGIQLDRTLHSMLTAALDVDPPDSDQISFIYSTLLALHIPALSRGQAGQTPVSQRPIAAVHEITARIRTNLIGNECLLGREPETMSPWGLYFAYHICRIHMPSCKTSTVSAEVVKSLKETFKMIDARWSIAGAYLQLLEAQEATGSF